MKRWEAKVAITAQLKRHQRLAEAQHQPLAEIYRREE